MIHKIYDFLLWFMGFPSGLHITDILRNQKARLGVFWWVAVGGTFGGLIALVLHIIGIF